MVEDRDCIFGCFQVDDSQSRSLIWTGRIISEEKFAKLSKMITSSLIRRKGLTDR